MRECDHDDRVDVRYEDRGEWESTDAGASRLQCSSDAWHEFERERAIADALDAGIDLIEEFGAEPDPL